jgi:hypothetical protein
MPVDSTDAMRKRLCLEQFRHVTEIKIRDKRILFFALRTMDELDVDIFIPKLGCTLGEFGIFQIISESQKRQRLDETPTSYPAV